MPALPRRTHRFLAVTCGLVVASSAVLAVTTPSTAASLTGGALSVGVTSFDYSGGCTVTTTSPNPTTSTTFGVAETQAVSQTSSGTINHGTDVDDTTTVSGRSEATVTTTKSGGSFRSVSVRGTLRTSLDAQQGTGTECQGEVLAGSELDGTVVIDEPGWITVTGSLGASAGQLSIDLEGTTNDIDHHLDLDETKGRSSARFYVRAASYHLDVEADLYQYSPTPTALDLSRTTSYAASLSFIKAGYAQGPTTGALGRAVRLDDTVTCGPGLVQVTWRKPAGAIEVAKIRVDGRLRKTVKNPEPGQTVVLAGVARSANATVSVTAGGATARRTYEACG